MFSKVAGVVLMVLMPGWLYAQEPPPADVSKPGQTDLLEILVKELHISVKEKPPGKKRVSFSVIPVSTGSTGGDKVLVSSINAAFVLGDKHPTNYSSVYFLPYTDFGENLGFGLKANLWTARNKWNIPVEFRINRLAQYTYGLGSSTTEQDRVKLNFNSLRLYFSANRKIFSHFYAGAVFNYDRFYSVNYSDVVQPPNAFEEYPYGTSGSSNSTGITFNLLRDNRINSINPDKGFYTSVVYRINPTWLLNDTNWSSIYIDSRKYIPLDTRKRRILAIWAFYWNAFGSVPYLNLPATNMEFGSRSARGYANSRFRGNQMWYFEEELRFDLTDNGLLGAVIFMNIQSLAEPDTNEFKYINTGGGFGARVKFNKESNTNLTFDLGVGKNSLEFYIGLGEYF